jgi:cell division protein FtsB
MAVAARRLDAAATAPAPSRAPARARPATPRDRSERRPARRRLRVTRSLLWIGVVGALLAGIVALNVAVLQMRIERGRVGQDIAEIRAENAGLRAELSTAAALGRIEAAGRARLGLVEPGETVYLRLPSRPAR